MAKQSQGNLDQIDGAYLVYGFDGTHFVPVQVDTSGKVHILADKINQILKPVKVQTKVVSCPLNPMPIPGSDSATALESGDTIGNVFVIPVPKSGIIYSATLWDLDDEGTQVDLEIFKERIADVAVDAAFAPTDTEILNFVTEINFFAFDDHGTSQTSEVKNIGKAYSAPNGVFYIQAVTRSTPTIASGVQHRVQLQILSDDPNWQES